jgi:hypothetical protein
MSAAAAKEDLMRAIPCPNGTITVEKMDDGVLVSVPLQKRWWVRPPVTWIFPISSHRRVQLDAVGSWVLALCDGKRNVEQVIEQVMKKHQLSFHEARSSVLQFIRMLNERGVVALATKGRESRGRR